MNIITSKQAQEKIDQLITETHEPILLKGETLNGVLIAENDWKAIQ